MARGARKAKSLPYASAFFKQWKSQKKGKEEEGGEGDGGEQQQQQLDTKTITKQVPSKRCFLWAPPRAGGTRVLPGS